MVVRAGDYVLYDSESNADAFCCLEEALEKAVQECMELDQVHVPEGPCGGLCHDGVENCLVQGQLSA